MESSIHQSDPHPDKGGHSVRDDHEMRWEAAVLPEIRTLDESDAAAHEPPVVPLEGPGAGPLKAPGRRSKAPRLPLKSPSSAGRKPLFCGRSRLGWQ
jgi:hypothetical protein